MAEKKFKVAEEIPGIEEVDFFNVHTFYNRIKKCINKLPEGSELVLDISGVSGDSSWIGCLLTVKREIKERGCSLKVLGIEKCQKIMALCHLQGVL